MNELAVISPVRKTVRVKAPVAHAFEVFTSGLTRWWPHDHGVGKKPIQKVLLEPRLGGRWLEIAEDGTETSVATITLWEPPHRMVMLWQINAQWKPAPRCAGMSTAVGPASSNASCRKRSGAELELVCWTRRSPDGAQRNPGPVFPDYASPVRAPLYPDYVRRSLRLCGINNCE